MASRILFPGAKWSAWVAQSRQIAAVGRPVIVRIWYIPLMARTWAEYCPHCWRVHNKKLLTCGRNSPTQRPVSDRWKAGCDSCSPAPERAGVVAGGPRGWSPWFSSCSARGLGWLHWRLFLAGTGR